MNRACLKSLTILYRLKSSLGIQSQCSIRRSYRDRKVSRDGSTASRRVRGGSDRGRHCFLPGEKWVQANRGRGRVACVLRQRQSRCANCSGQATRRTTRREERARPSLTACWPPCPGGFLALDWCDSSPVGPLARRSFALHAELAGELGASTIGYRRMRTHSISVRQGKAQAGACRRGLPPKPRCSGVAG